MTISVKHEIKVSLKLKERVKVKGNMGQLVFCAVRGGGRKLFD